MTTLKELEAKLASIENELGNAQEAERRMAVELVTRSKELADCEKDRNAFQDQCIALKNRHVVEFATEQAYSARLREVIRAYVNAGFGAATDLDKQAVAYRLAIDSVRQGHDTTAFNQYVAEVLNERAESLRELTLEDVNEYAADFNEGVNTAADDLQRFAERLLA